MLPSQREIELPLLKTIADLGGKAKPSEIYPRLQEVFSEINDSDLAMTLPSGANKWKNCIAWVRQKLILQGEMQSLARGVWAITEKGRGRLESPASYRATLRTKRGKEPTSTLRFIENLLPATSKSVLQEARRRDKPTGDPAKDFENSVWRLIQGLTPSAITLGRDPTIRLPSSNFRPDVIALFEETRFFLGECKLTSSAAYLTNWLSEFRSVRRELEESLRKSGYSQSVFVLFVRNKAEVDRHVKSDAENLRVRMVDEREVRYFHALQTESGIGISHMFWARVAPSLIRNQDLRLPALRIKGHSRRDAYIFSMNAHDLLSRCFVSHRDGYSGEGER